MGERIKIQKKIVDSQFSNAFGELKTFGDKAAKYFQFQYKMKRSVKKIMNSRRTWFLSTLAVPIQANFKDMSLSLFKLLFKC